MFVKQLFLILSFAILGFAFQEVPGNPCTGSGPCSYDYSGSEGPVTVFGNCAPGGYCADNGATCDTDYNCYTSCGSGVCGGAGAECTSTNPFTHGQTETTCNTDAGVTCDTRIETCIAPQAGPEPSARRRRSVQPEYPYKQYKPRRAAPSWV
nr:uncharacterized protein CI109_001208 [Kwoniella shandongensis]KAA5530405.1 hypothetical protein CI109_001208 [Kwoniella shandongensis]